MANKALLAIVPLLISTSLLCDELVKITTSKTNFYKEKVQNYRNYDEAVKFCGSFGYRLPNILDYLELDDSSKEGMEKSLYWSQKPSKDGSKAYYYSTKDNDVNLMDKKSNLYLLCTDKKLEESLKNRFQRTSAGILDGKTNLTWQLKTKETKKERFDFEDAKKQCSNLNISGTKGWRMPSLAELYALADAKNENEKEFTSFFDDTQPRYYRSGDELGNFSDASFVVGFKMGSIANLSNKEQVFTRCVRDNK
jgi:hypothetical protein